MQSNLAYERELREELIGGKLVAMSPSPVWAHVSIAGKIYTLFSNYLKGKKCTPIPDGFDLHLDENNIFVPDMMVVCDRSKIRRSGVFGAPDLVVEILSPSTAHRDRSVKKDAYEAAGVREYWIVSPGEQSIEQYLLQEGRLTLHATYSVYPDYMRETMSEKERAEIVTEFQCSLYDDLTLSLADIFEGCGEL